MEGDIMANIKKVRKPRNPGKTVISFHTRNILIAITTFIILPIIITLNYILGIGLLGIVLFFFLGKLIVDFVSRTVEVTPEGNPLRFN